MPEEDLASVEADWAKASYDEKKRWVWDVSKILDQEDAEDEEAEAQQQQQPPRHPGPRAPDGEDAWAYTTHPTMGRDGFNWTQLSMSRAGNFPRNSAGRGGIREWSVADAEALGPMGVWHKSFARSIPARIDATSRSSAEVETS